jgi:amino acid permease
MTPGVILYVLFGVFAFLGGLVLWKTFLKLDSARYPIKLYGDLGERIFGVWARFLSNFLQLIQLTLNVGLIVRIFAPKCLMQSWH